MSNIPEEDDLVLPQEGSTEETVEFEGGAELVEMAEATEEVEALEEVEGADVAPIVVGQADAEVEEAEEVMDAEVEEVMDAEVEEEEGPREPGLTTAGQYLAASCIAFWIMLVIVGICWLIQKRFTFDDGIAVIVVPISLACALCSTIGILAQPERRERFLLLPTLGPLLPLATGVGFFITGPGALGLPVIIALGVFVAFPLPFLIKLLLLGFVLLGLLALFLYQAITRNWF